MGVGVSVPDPRGDAADDETELLKLGFGGRFPTGSSQAAVRGSRTVTSSS